MKVIFCNIASIKYYKGIIKNIDEPRYGGEYVTSTGDAHEKYNFQPIDLDGTELCLGFFETKTTNGVTRNELHLEKIEGYSINNEIAYDVLVVWCAKLHDGRTTVVGWYKKATVYRRYKIAEIELDDGIYEQSYNIEADVDNCLLLPDNERNRFLWNVPRKSKGRAFGFGQANIWYALEPKAEDFVRQLVNSIEEYQGNNWLYKYPE